MLNLAGPSYDFGNVIFAVLQECEHRRAGFVDSDAGVRMREVAARKLQEIESSYREAGGTDPYWEELRREISDTVLPQYISAAIEQTKRERTNYGLWRGADFVARAAFALLGLTVGGIIIEVPFIPIFAKWFAFGLAAVGWFYPELKKKLFEYRHSRLLNRLITDGEKYQKNDRLHYLTNAQLEEAFRDVESDRTDDDRRRERAGAAHSATQPDLTKR